MFLLKIDQRLKNGGCKTLAILGKNLNPKNVTKLISQKHKYRKTPLLVPGVGQFSNANNFLVGVG
jgi:hypothetical protein